MLVCLTAGSPATARATWRNDAMKDRVMLIRGLVDRAGATHHFRYPLPSQVCKARLAAAWWPANPWTGQPMFAGTSRGHYSYSVSSDRRAYRLVGYLGRSTFVVGGRIPDAIVLGYDHRGEEGLNLIRQYVEQWARAHSGLYPAAQDVARGGAVNRQPGCGYWPSNPWDHAAMAQRLDHGSFTYRVTASRSAYTLSLHRARKNDYKLTGASLTDPWQRLIVSLEDDILRRNGRILAGFVETWCLQYAGALPSVADFSPGGAVGASVREWPVDPLSGGAMVPGTAPGTFTYLPGLVTAFGLTVHLHGGDYDAGGTAPLPSPAVWVP